MLMKIGVLNLRKNEGLFVGAGQALGVHQQPRFEARESMSNHIKRKHE